MFSLRKISASLMIAAFMVSGGFIVPSLASLVKGNVHASHACCEPQSGPGADSGYLRPLEQCSMPCCGGTAGPEGLKAAANGDSCAAGMCMNNPAPAMKTAGISYRENVQESSNKERTQGITGRVRIIIRVAGIDARLLAMRRAAGASFIHFNRDIFLSTHSYLI